MSRTRRFLLVTLGLGLAGAIGAAFGAGTAQAVVASLVEIVNPATAPVPMLNVTDPGRVAYQSTINNVGKCLGAPECEFSFPSVPAGHRVVIQHISGYLQFSTQALTAYVAAEVESGVFGPLSTFYAPVPTGSSVATLDKPALFYVDSSDSFVVIVHGSFGSSFVGVSIAPQYLTVTGYELDCAVAACPAIATQ